MKCPECNKNMVKRTGNLAIMTYPAQYPWHWWCACGHIEYGGVDKGETEQEAIMKAWKDANKESTNDR